MHRILAVASRSMRRQRLQRFVRVVFAVLLVLSVLPSSIGLAAPPDQEVPAATDIPLSAAFTYQGRLDVAGTPVNATCAMQFDLWNAGTGGTQVGATQSLASVSVVSGLFNVTLNQSNEFGATPFTGDARFLEMAVQCPGDASFVTLPRQQLTATPYALTSLSAVIAQSTNSLRGQPVSNAAPAAGNVLTWNGSQWQGAALPAQIPTDWSAITGKPAGFADNIDHEGWMLTGNPDATASGVLGPTTNVTMTIVVSGTPVARFVPGLEGAVFAPSVILGSPTNGVLDSSFGATVAGGGSGNNENTVADNYGTVGGGLSNQAGAVDGSNTSNASATVAGGHGNRAGGALSSVGGGRANFADGDYSTVSGGRINEAQGDYSVVPGGEGAIALLRAQFAFASGGFDVGGGIQDVGSAQYAMYVLRNTSTGNSQSRDLFIDGNNDLLTVREDSVMVFEVYITARGTDGDAAGWRGTGVIHNNGGTVSFAGTAPTVLIGSNTAGLTVGSVTLVADDANNALVIRTNSGSAGALRWSAIVTAVEVQS